MATLKDVAREVGVSVATVSYVLNNTGSVSVEVSKKVRAAVNKLNYRPNRQAQAMRTGLSQSLGLVIPDLSKPFYPELAKHVESEARSRGMAVVLIHTQNSVEAEAEGFSILSQQNVDGIIWCPVSDHSPQALLNMNCPVVLVNRPMQGFDIVHANYKAGGALAAEYTIKLGHNKVGLLLGPSNLERAIQQRKGFLESAAGHLDIVWDIECSFEPELSTEVLESFDRKEVSMIVAVNDLIAISAINALADRNISVPQDVSIIGFDDIPLATILRPRLTTIAQPMAAMGREAVDTLLKRIKTPAQDAQSTVLDVRLIERDSTIPYQL